MKNICVAIASFLLSVNLFSQTPGWAWEKSIGGAGDDVVLSAVSDSLGNIYSCGSFQGTVDFDPGAGIFNLTSNGDYDIFILKLDSGGRFCWAKAMGGTAFDRCFSLALDASGNIYSTGQFTGTADFNPGTGVFNLTGGGIFISKLDSSGNFIWAKAVPGGGGYSIALDVAGNIYTSGYFSGTTDFDPGVGVSNATAKGGTDIFILKLNDSGNFLWAKTMGGGSSDIAWSIAVDRTGSGDVYTTGLFIDTVDFDPGTGIFNIISGGSSSVFISKLSSTGDFLWAKAIGGVSLDFSGGLSVAVSRTGSGSIYTTGFFSGVDDFDPGAGVFNLTALGSNDIFVSKLDSSGNFIWAKQMGGINNDVGLVLALDASDNIYTSGFFEGVGDFAPGAGFFNLTSAGDRDIFVSKLDSSGNFEWAQQIGGSLPDDGRAIALDAYGNVIVAGDFYSPLIAFDTTILLNAAAGSSDILIAKLNAGLVTAVEESGSLSNNISFFPNPASTEVTVSFAKEVHGTMILCNMMGEILEQIQITSSVYKLNISNKPSGVYFITVTGEDGTKAAKKIIKM